MMATEHRTELDGYVPSAIVRRPGGIEEVDGVAGARALREHPELLALVDAFLGGADPRLDFFWLSPEGSWLRVALEREPPVGEGEAATVVVTEEPLPYGLTAREMDVLTLLAGGLTNQEIAAALVTSNRTIGTHVEHLLRKTELANRAALAAMSVRLGLIRLPLPGQAEAVGGDSLHPAPLDAPTPQPVTAAHVRRAKRPFIIGSAFPLQGEGSADGHEMRNGSALAIAEINARGGIAGRPIRQVVVDLDISAGESILESFEELVSAEVDAITSGYLFVDEAARDLAAEYGAPYLHAMTSEQSVQEVRESPDTHGHIFQVCPPEGLYGSGFIRFLDDLSATGQWQPPNRSLAFIETPVPGGQMANLATFEQAEASGWSISSCDLVPQSGTVWGPVVERLRRLNPAAVMVTHFLPDQLAEFQRLFAQQESETLVYAVYAPSIPQFLELAGEAADGMLWSTVTGTYGDPVGSQFFKRYRNAYGRPPGRSHAGIAYDEVHLLAQAWAHVANPRNFSAVAAHLRTATYRGVNGSYFLDNAGQCGLAYPDVTLDPSLGQAHLVFQVQDGAHRILSPSPYVEAPFRRPPWLPGALSTES